MSDAPPPYRSGLATGLGVVLPAGLVMAIVDTLHAGGGALALFGLWALVALPIALGCGVVLAAGNATWGTGWVRRMFRRLRDDAALDRAVAGALIAALALGGVLAIGIEKLALGLIEGVQRKHVGALIVGVVVVGALPVVALCALPLYRATRQIARFIPAIGPLPRVVVIALGGALALVAAAFYVVTRGDLDVEKLDLMSLIAPALVPVIALATAILAYGPLARVRERIPRRGAIAAAAGVVAVVLPLVGLSGTPSDSVKTAVIDRSYIGHRAIDFIRKLDILGFRPFDRDHDGYSAFFGGPDCDDHDASVHPGAKDDIVNGIDKDCDGVVARAPKPDVKPTTPTTVDAKPTLTGGTNVVVLFVDTLRFDRLGIAGYQRDGKSLTPRIDAFAKQSVVFSHAYAQAPNTPRSVPSFLASRYPSQLVVDDPQADYATLADDNDMLFEALRPAGFTTIGETSHFYFCDRKKYPDTCENVLNIDGKPMRTNAIQGAVEWDNRGAVAIPPSNHDIAGPRITEKAIAKLDQLAKDKTKFAMIVHLFDPHSTYMEHPGFKYTEHGTKLLEQKYDYEIAFEDELVGKILDELDKTGLAKDTTVVLMADHGEAFGVHLVQGKPDFFHGDTLYAELLHVPLIFRVPGGKPATRDDVVQLVDLAPTITALFGVAAPSTWIGRSLVPALDGKPLAPKPAFAQMLKAHQWPHEARSVISADGKRHLYHRMSDGQLELYDLEHDPDEKTNVFESDARSKELRQELADWAAGL
jgi:arylsulfatase A-like enzyme